MKKASLILSLSLNIGIAFSQKARDYSQIVNELVAQIEEANTTSKALRIAVVPFIPSAATPDEPKAFGEYLTESINGKLSEKPHLYKVFERKRLDAIFKENQLMLSGMMKPSEALKIGELLSIDAVFSGTYTKLKSYVEVSGRLIDVTSGEIMTSYSGRVKLTKNIQTLFDNPQTNTNAAAQENSQNANPNIMIVNQINTNQNSKQKTREEICEDKVKAFKPRLDDLSSQEKIDAVVVEATKTPFDNLCGRLHYDVLYIFTRYKLDPPAYKTFLEKTLDTLSFPTEDDRGYEIIRFFANDKKIDEEEWKVGFKTISRVGNYSLSSYVSALIGRTEDPLEDLKQRVDDVANAALKNKIGLPRPLDFNNCFLELMEGLDHNNPLRIYSYGKYGKNFSMDEKNSPRIISLLTSMYKNETRQAEKAKVLGWIVDYFNNNSFPKSADQLYDFAFSFRFTGYEANDEKTKINFPAGDLKILCGLCKSKFSEYAMTSQYESQKEDRINFCAQNNIPIPGVIPADEEAIKIFQGSNSIGQLQTIKLISQKKDLSPLLEPSLIGLFDKRSLDNKEELNEAQTIAISLLGKMKTNNAKAISYIIQRLNNYDNPSDNAKDALALIGKPAVQPLIKRLTSTNDQDGGLRYKIIFILGKIGKEAKPAEGILNQMLKTETNSDIKYAIEAALQEMR
jgi:TolB-like protein